MRGQGQLLAQDLGELLERDVHLQLVLPLALARLALARLHVARASVLAHLAVALAHAACCLCPKRKGGCRWSAGGW
jgi:hypothetical protein